MDSKKEITQRVKEKKWVSKDEAKAIIQEVLGKDKDIDKELRYLLAGGYLHASTRDIKTKRSICPRIQRRAFA